MKESNFYSDDFEQLIRDKTEQYKMYPSENVWKGVHNSLHTKRKWFIGSMALLVTGILYFSGKELIAPPAHAPNTHKAGGTAGAGADLAATDPAAADPAKTNTSEDLPHSSFVTLRPNNSASTSLRHNGMSGGSSGLTITISNPVISQPDIARLLSHLAPVTGQAPALIAATGTGTNEDAASATGKPTSDVAAEPGLLDSWLVKGSSENAAAHKTADVVTAGHSNSESGVSSANGLREPADVAASKEAADAGNDDAAVRSVLESLSYKAQQRIGGSSHLAHTTAGNARSVDGEPLPDSAGDLTALASTEAIGEDADRQRLNWLHDYAVYTLPPTPAKSRLLLQFTLTPTVNYRSLSGGTYPTLKTPEGAPVTAVRPEGVQNWVNLSPGFGFEFGSNVLYRVTRNLSLKAGLQFNFNRYQMPAYISKASQSGQSGSSNQPETYYGSYMDSVDAIANYGSYAGKTTETLTNNFYQLAAPIGFELRILGNEQLQLNIAATIQPSFLLNTDSYMLSSDYSNYTKQPAQYRRWNISGEVEAFLSYQTGPLRWQIGPEFRYQMLSTYITNYPINENVKGYGLKIGITKALPY